MKFAVFEYDDSLKIGVIEGETIKALLNEPDLLGVAGLSKDELENPKYSGEEYNVNEVTMMSPVLVPPRIFGIGLNYLDHALETGRKPPEVQTWFMKQPTSANEPYGDVEKPVVSDWLDYEVELVVIIGKTCRHVPEDRANEVILGYCVGCDYSVRDWQTQTPTMIMGKGFDTHAPFGPYLVTSDELGNLDELRLRCFVNDEKLQDGIIGEMIFKVPQLIAHVTKAMTLLPGDVIFTGTPAGVGVARVPPKFLKVGDIVRCEIDKIGYIENEIIAEIKETIIE